MRDASGGLAFGNAPRGRRIPGRPGPWPASLRSERPISRPATRRAPSRFGEGRSRMSIPSMAVASPAPRVDDPKLLVYAMVRSPFFIAWRRSLARSCAPSARGTPCSSRTRRGSGVPCRRRGDEGEPLLELAEARQHELADPSGVLHSFSSRIVSIRGPAAAAPSGLPPVGRGASEGRLQGGVCACASVVITAESGNRPRFPLPTGGYESGHDAVVLHPEPFARAPKPVIISIPIRSAPSSRAISAIFFIVPRRRTLPRVPWIGSDQDPGHGFVVSSLIISARNRGSEFAEG